jgi:predicted transcriptional regulator
VSQCLKCHAPLSSDEIAIYRKLVNRGAAHCMCIDCLAAYMETTRQEIENLIRYYKESGQCTLF